VEDIEEGFDFGLTGTKELVELIVKDVLPAQVPQVSESKKDQESLLTRMTKKKKHPKPKQEIPESSTDHDSKRSDNSEDEKPVPVSKPVRRVLSIKPVVAVKEPEPAPQVEPDVKKKKEKLAVKKEEPIVKRDEVKAAVEVVDDVEPVISRMTKKKKFKPVEIKAKKKRETPDPTPEPSPVTSPVVKMAVLEKIPVKTVDPVATVPVVAVKERVIMKVKPAVIADADYIPIDYDSVQELVSTIDKFTTDLNETIQYLRTLKTNQEAREEFKKFSKQMTVEQFIRICVDPVLQTSIGIFEGIGFEADLCTDLEVKLKWKELAVRAGLCTARFKDLKAYLNAPFVITGKKVSDKVDISELSRVSLCGGIFDNYHLALQELQKCCSDVINCHRPILEFEFEPPTPQMLSPDIYLEQLLQTIHDLVFQGRNTNSQKLQKLLKKADPLYALAAATGLEPLELAKMTTKEQLDFIKSVQLKFPDPLQLITQILENGPLGFQEPKNKVEELERLVALNIKEHEVLEKKFEKVKGHNDEWRDGVIWGLGYVSEDDDEEWVDE
jgi:hypothetical protein